MSSDCAILLGLDFGYAKTETPLSPAESPKYVDTFYGPTHDRARSRDARSSLQHLPRGAVRPVAVHNGDDPTNARPGGTPSGQARVGLP